MTGRCVECGRELNADGRCDRELRELQVVGLVFLLVLGVVVLAWWWFG